MHSVTFHDGSESIQIVITDTTVVVRIVGDPFTRIIHEGTLVYAGESGATTTFPMGSSFKLLWGVEGTSGLYDDRRITLDRTGAPTVAYEIWGPALPPKYHDFRVLFTAPLQASAEYKLYK